MADRPCLFISNTERDPRDATLARVLAHGLGGRGAEVILAPEYLQPGDDWNQRLEKAIAACSHFLPILSAASVTSQWVLWEIAAAKRRIEQSRDFKIVPL